MCNGVSDGEEGAIQSGDHSVQLSELSTAKLGIRFDNSLCSIRTPGRDVVNDHLILVD